MVSVVTGHESKTRANRLRLFGECPAEIVGWPVQFRIGVNMRSNFLYACSGLLALTLAVHAGARMAAAQDPDPIVGISTAPCGGLVAVSQSGIVYAKCLNVWEQKANVPGPVSCIFGEPGQYIIIVLQNGDVYETPGANSWEFYANGNVRGGPTPANRKSLGQVKTKWR